MSKELQWLDNRIKWHKDCLNGTPQKELIPKLKEDLQMLKDMRDQLQALEIIKENLNIDEILLAVKGVCKASDYDLVKKVLL